MWTKNRSRELRRNCGPPHASTQRRNATPSRAAALRAIRRSSENDVSPRFCMDSCQPALFSCLWLERDRSVSASRRISSCLRRSCGPSPASLPCACDTCRFGDVLLEGRVDCGCGDDFSQRGRALFPRHRSHLLQFQDDYRFGDRCSSGGRFHRHAHGLVLWRPGDPLRLREGSSLAHFI